jgi:hypothetical protein
MKESIHDVPAAAGHLSDFSRWCIVSGIVSNNRPRKIGVDQKPQAGFLAYHPWNWSVPD